MPAMRVIALCVLVQQLAREVDSTEGSRQIFNREVWLDIGGTAPGPPPVKPRSWAHLTDPSTQIFVSVVDYRDDKCAATLKALFDNAEYPDRLQVGLIQQKRTEDEDCLTSFCRSLGFAGVTDKKCTRLNQISTILTHHIEARGPMFARAMNHQLMKDEEFCLQIDAHMSFAKNWDGKLLELWGQAENEYAVLSSSPPDISLLADNPEGLNDVVPHLCQHEWTERGLPRNLQATAARGLTKPLLAASWNAGFSFSKCHLDAKVPYDPNLLNAYEGEEFVRYARMWTHGYDVYTPPKALVFHDYESAHVKPFNPREWIEKGMSSDFVRQEHDAANRRMYTVLGMPGGDVDAESVASLTRFGLGNKRTLDEFIEFTGVDVRTRTVFKDSCRPLKWVPYKPDLDPSIEEDNVWGLDAERVTASMTPRVITSVAPKRRIATTDRLVVRQEFGAGDQSTGLFVSFIRLFDPMIDAVMEPFVDKLGPVNGLKAFKIFLASLPIFFGFLAAAYFAIISRDDGDERFESKKEYLAKSPMSKKVID